MKTHHLTIIICFLSIVCSYGQIKNTSCVCAKNQFTGTTIPDTIFTLSNNKKIAICGYRNLESAPTTFSEFVLSVCGEESIIDFWDATTICQLETKKDTLLVNELYILPIAKKLGPQEAIWITDKIYFKGNKLIRDSKVNRKIRKYNSSEILEVLKKYESEIVKTDFDKIEFASKLFVATISGSEKARNYFILFPSKFKMLDGGYKEEYDELVEMLKLWDKE